MESAMGEETSVKADSDRIVMEVPGSVQFNGETNGTSDEDMEACESPPSKNAASIVKEDEKMEVDMIVNHNNKNSDSEMVNADILKDSQNADHELENKSNDVDEDRVKCNDVPDSKTAVVDVNSSDCVENCNSSPSVENCNSINCISKLDSIESQGSESSKVASENKCSQLVNSDDSVEELSSKNGDLENSKDEELNRLESKSEDKNESKDGIDPLSESCNSVTCKDSDPLEEAMDTSEPVDSNSNKNEEKCSSDKTVDAKEDNDKSSVEEKDKDNKKTDSEAAKNSSEDKGESNSKGAEKSLNESDDSDVLPLDTPVKDRSSKADKDPLAEGDSDNKVEKDSSSNVGITEVKDAEPEEAESSSKNKKSRKSIVSNIIPRRSSRNINKTIKTYDKEEEPDIEEITPEDPLADTGGSDPFHEKETKSRHSRKSGGGAIVVNDTKRLAEIASGSKQKGKKEPTLVIIDTNSILSGHGPIPVSQPPVQSSVPHTYSQNSHSQSSSSSGSSTPYSVLPVAVPAQGLYPAVPSSPQIPITLPVPVRMNSPVISPAASLPQPRPPPPAPPQILPSLTDDMYVVEAPSFIVPYVYEKPPLNPLKDFISELSKKIEEIKAKEKQESEEAEKALKEKEKEEEKSDKEKKEEEKDDKEKSDSSEAKSEKVNETEKSEAMETEDEDSAKKDSETDTQDKECKETEVEAKKDEEAESITMKESKEKDTSEVKKEEEKPVEGDSAKSAEKSSSTVDESSKNEEKSKSETATTADEEKSKTEVTDSSAKSTENDTKDKDNDKEEKVKGDDESKAKDDKDAKTDKPKVATYFDNPLGKFFMQIGLNLVQEFVQTDLLRSQKRKRDREGGKGGAVTQYAINSLIKNLEYSKENNEPFHLDLKKCEYCSFKTESSLVMAQHLETPHMRNYVYHCNFCPLEVRSPHDILFHMEAEHNVRGRLERAPAFHQCPNCPFEDNQKGKLTRHLVSCSKKYKAERNLEPPSDWEPPAKIPRVSRSRPPSLGLGAAAYQAMAAKQGIQHPGMPKLAPSQMSNSANLLQRGRGRPPMHSRYLPDMKQQPMQRPIAPQMRQGMIYRPSGSGSQPQVLLPTAYQISGNQLYTANVVGNQSQMMPMVSGGGLQSVPRLTLMSPTVSTGGTPTPVALVPNIAAGGSTNAITIQNANKNPASKLLQQPSISITPLPRQPAAIAPGNPANTKGQQGNKSTFVICEICDGYIKDLEQLRNHMQWIHKVKIHPKMIYNRPPLNCQKCQFRFFTDQGLERHLLGSHGLVTSSMQEAANKGKDGGRCPVCGRVYQWKLLNHVARDHNMTLKPAHLSYKCTVCTATFGMYKQFENHVYSAHSVVAKRVMDKKTPQQSRQQSDSLLKPLKINDEITIIPQPTRSRPDSGNRTGASASDENEVIDLEESPAKGKENGDESLTAVKERLRRRKSLEISQVDSECSSPQSNEDNSNRKRRRNDD